MKPWVSEKRNEKVQGLLSTEEVARWTDEAAALPADLRVKRHQGSGERQTSIKRNQWRYKHSCMTEQEHGSTKCGRVVQEQFVAADAGCVMSGVTRRKNKQEVKLRKEKRNSDLGAKAAFWWLRKGGANIFLPHDCRKRGRRCRSNKWSTNSGRLWSGDEK